MDTHRSPIRQLTRQSGLARLLRCASYIVIPTAAVFAAVFALLAMIAHPVSIQGQPSAGEAVITITSHVQVHATGHGGCYVRTPQRYDMTLLGGGVRTGVLGPGRLQADGSCAFAATLPALASATEIAVNGGEHAIRTGAGAITLSSDDGLWVPLKTGVA